MTSPTSKTDAELLRLIAAGDEDAFTTLYRRRQGGVYRFALQMSGSPAVAEDVTQEVFLVLMREAARYDPSRGSLAAYLYGIARNHVLRVFERERPWVALEGGAEESDEAWSERLVAADDPLGDLTRGEMIERLQQAVLALPAHYREVVVLCELHEMSYAEASAVLSCAVGTVRSRLHRARALLVERLRAADGRDESRRAAHDDASDAEQQHARDGAATQHDAPTTLETARCFI